MRVFDNGAIDNIMENLAVNVGSLKDILELVMKGGSLQDISNIASKAIMMWACGEAVNGIKSSEEYANISDTS